MSDENAHFLLATGLARRRDTVLMVASSYPSQPRALWNLPGGRVERGELLRPAVVREIREETGLDSRVGDLAYVSESYDPTGRHILNVTFLVEVFGEIRLPDSGDHIVDAAWVPLDELATRIEIAVVREPLVDFLGSGQRYYGRQEAGVTVEWPAT